MHTLYVGNAGVLPIMDKLHTCVLHCNTFTSMYYEIKVLASYSVNIKYMNMEGYCRESHMYYSAITHCLIIL